MNIKVHLAEWLINFDKKSLENSRETVTRNIYYRLY